MTSYANKYPHPGSRPPEEGVVGDSTSNFDTLYRAFRLRAERMDDWKVNMKKHAVARAIDDSMEALQRGALGRGVTLQEEVETQAGKVGLVVVWLSFLGEPLPPELFP